MSYIAERRVEEKERRRTEILAAAERLYSDKGWEAVTMDQVARSARLSRALLYLYFGDKEELLFGISEREQNLPLLTRSPCRQVPVNGCFGALVVAILAPAANLGVGRGRGSHGSNRQTAAAGSRAAMVSGSTAMTRARMGRHAADSRTRNPPMTSAVSANDMSSPPPADTSA